MNTDDRVASILPTAADLADAVDNCDADRIATLLHRLDRDNLYALAVVLAANVDLPITDDRREPSDVDEAIVWRILAGDSALAGIATPAERAMILDRWASTGRTLNELESLTGWNGNRERRRAVAACGTDSGYYRHRRTLREPACGACVAAHSEAERNRKQGAA